MLLFTCKQYQQSLFFLISPLLLITRLLNRINILFSYYIYYIIYHIRINIDIVILFNIFTEYDCFNIINIILKSFYTVLYHLLLVK